MVTLIAAVAENGVIGAENGLPWHFPEDLKFFKEQTLGKTLLMGRKTFEGMGSRPLPGRKTLVLTRDKTWQAEGVSTVSSLSQALQVAGGELVVAGGAQVYELALPVADKIMLSRLPVTVEGDAVFPQISSEAWSLDTILHKETFTVELYQRIK